MGSHILVVDDEPMVREVVARYLERDGFVVTELGDGTAAVDWLTDNQCELVVLDLMLPGVDGLTILRQLRSVGQVPVILLTARAEEADRVVGLELGADDYVVKPFSPRELAARVRTVLRRSASSPAAAPELIEHGELVIDRAAREVRLGSEVVPFTPKEFDLLATLAASPRQVFSRDQLLEQVWESSAEWQDPATVTVHVRRVRHKIEDDPNDPRWIVTVFGVGYRFEPGG